MSAAAAHPASRSTASQPAWLNGREASISAETASPCRTRYAIFRWVSVVATFRRFRSLPSHELLFLAEPRSGLGSVV
jgi:hypothetical protein